MFTGLVECIGTVHSLQRRGPDALLRVAVKLDDIQLGESIAVAGVCLTVTQFTAAGFTADMSSETLALTTLGELRSGQSVNIERATPAGGRLGGHIVQGHVDAVGTVVALEALGRARRLQVRAPAVVARFIASKGSIAIDGVSLTINALHPTVDGVDFDVMLVPHTQSMTTLPALKIGSQVNLEADVLARYVARQLEFARGQGASGPEAADPAAGGMMAALRRGGYLD